uniref:Fibulin 2 n=1 Tax=Neogobius melanostomus TaxID=47308 RepID=A0A8C6UAI8_9GOBI
MFYLSGNMRPQKTFLYLLILYLDMSYAQKDCTGVDCPTIHHCIETVLETGSCCPTCSRRGCTCEGYQYYDCIQAGFRRGKVPEGESYFVDFGSTECSCPRGGGNISCHFIPCPEIPPNCIDVMQPQDGCPQCGRIGCVHGNKKYDAGHSFQIESCQVCHCPNNGGSLTCSIIPGCVSENKGPLRDISQTNQAESTSNFGNTLPLYKPDPPSSGTGDSDYTLARPTSSTQNLEQPPESTTLPPPHQESTSISHDERRREPKQTHGRPNPEQSGRAKVSSNPNPTVSESHKESLQTGETSPGKTTSVPWCPSKPFVHCVVSMSLLCARTSQQQCCLGSLREQQCLSGVKAATAGGSCEKDSSDKCAINSFKECCGCCSLGLHFRADGMNCEAHPSLGFHCRHIFMACCEGEQENGHNAWHPIRERPAMDPTALPKRVSDSPFPKEAFSLGQGGDGENAVESPVEVEDMDECLIYEGSICHHKCVNTLGSFRCECFPGYVLQDDAVTCRTQCKLLYAEVYVNELVCDCLSENNPCEQQCTPVGGWPQCSCFPGYALATNGYSCEDINECLSAQACQLSERCVNTAGSYTCQRLISCPTGYHVVNDMCEDVDECVQRSHSCGPDLDCVNTIGSFRCNPKPRCATGFSKDLQGNYVDECTLSQPCGPGSNCINTVGSYVCNRKIICSRGYHSSPDGSRCIDVDECQNGLHRCGEGQHCLNMAGSYRCECQTGYQYDSFKRMCVDINECWRYSGRLCAQTCVNTLGSYHCSCTVGFRLSGDGKTCEDVNECLSNPCGQECSNIYGSYQCYCTQGYYLREDGHSCDDIDECSQSIGHLCTYKCVNVAGSYHCACPEYGYTMSPNGRSCRDIDECTTGTHNCSLSETFSDTRCERISCPNYLDCQTSPLRITYYYLSFQSNIVIPAQIFRIGPSPAYSGDNVIVSITQGNEENYFSTRKLSAYTGAVYLHRQVEGPRDFLITVEMKLWRQGTFTTFQARIYVFITRSSL